MVSTPMMTPDQLHGANPAAEPTPWWLSPLLGVLSIIAGIMVLARPGGGLTLVAVVSGIFLLIDSLYEFATSFRRNSDERALGAVIGLLGIIAGILLIRHPVNSVTAIAIILGLWLVAIGATRLAVVLLYERRFVTGALACVQLLCGAVIVSSPGIGLATLALLAGISFLLNGAALIALGWMLRQEAHQPPARAVPAPSA
jgi:uncharacterized membrane protein HdeD (DUF308 family)